MITIMDLTFLLCVQHLVFMTVGRAFNNNMSSTSFLVFVSMQKIINVVLSNSLQGD